VTLQRYYRDLDRRVDENGEKCVTCCRWTRSQLYIGELICEYFCETQWWMSKFVGDHINDLDWWILAYVWHERSYVILMQARIMHYWTVACWVSNKGWCLVR